MKEKIEELMNDSELVKELLACGSKEEVLEHLVQNGIELKEEELKAWIGTQEVSAGGELDETVLEEVSGGAGLVPAILFDLLKKLFGWK